MNPLRKRSTRCARPKRRSAELHVLWQYFFQCSSYKNLYLFIYIQLITESQVISAKIPVNIFLHNVKKYTEMNTVTMLNLSVDSPELSRLRPIFKCKSSVKLLKCQQGVFTH